jgi:8-oxo-dGTP pyrophosphatase MutT (NUDIX family)
MLLLRTEKGFMKYSNEIVERIKRNLNAQLPGELAQLRMTPSFRGELISKLNEYSPIRDSAVLITIFPFNGNLSTLLIKRPVYNGVHSGQISFPGGKFDENDISLKNTALRETFEEVGIHSDLIEVIGAISPLLIPVSNTKVLPYVGLLKDLPSLALNRREVDYTLIVPLLDFKNSENIKEKTLTISNKNIVAPYYDVQEEFIWGATAMIISEFSELY